jgi:anti-sigma factor RsiW
VKHFSLDEWADFVRGATTASQAAAMQKHLNGDCRECKKTVDAWTAIVAFAEREAANEPPADAVRVATSYFAPFKLASKQNRVLQLAKLAFDSLEPGTVLGVRGSGSFPQHLTYRCGNVFIDLRLVPRPDTRSMALAGQVVDSRPPGSGLAGVPVSLLSAEDTWLETTTDQLGEFHFSFPPAENVKLLFGTDGAAVLVLLPSASVGLA